MPSVLHTSSPAGFRSHRQARYTAGLLLDFSKNPNTVSASLLIPAAPASHSPTRQSIV